tara:strand:+ start:6616 stop:7404 length:789 start_codon:yes stop_codon:yes gene_type:complete
MKTIYYYQTFIGLYKMLSHIQDIDVIIVSSIHFGKEKDGEKKIYLNDNSPDNNIFDDLWMETKKASVQGCKIMVMMGGAGLAYNELFTDFNVYYPQLVQMLKDRPWIQGVDLDIEEHASLENIQMLINKLVEDFGEEFTITMAPISSSLMNDGGSISGINYKQLYQSDEGKYIHWFNTQCYDSFTKDTYDSIIQNGYPPEKIVMGMESGQFNENTFKGALETIVQIKKKYPQVGGFYDWEYLNAPPDKKDPSQWAKLIKQCL